MGGNTYQTAQDARFTVDNVTMTRTTNQGERRRARLTLNLLRTTTSPVRVTVSDDAAALKTKVQAFVTAPQRRGERLAHRHGLRHPARASNTELAGDRVMRGSLDRLSRASSTTTSPAPPAAYTTLASAGVSLQNDGTLRLNDATFHRGPRRRPASVAGSSSPTPRAARRA